MIGSKEEEKIGAVMVVGAGIGGMQASLDLAESGFLVYLVEASTAIGGAMAQLDKTFPTNDCAMCIVAPKLVDVGRHPNIKLLTSATVEKVDDFKRKLHSYCPQDATIYRPVKVHGLWRLCLSMPGGSSE